MTQIRISQMLTSFENEAVIVDKFLTQIEQKLQGLIIKAGSPSILGKEDSEIFTTDERGNLRDQKPTTSNLQEKCIKVLYQVQLLQAEITDKAVPLQFTDSKVNCFGVKKSFQSASSKKHLESYIENSFALKDKSKDEALKQIILTLCNESELELKSRIFLKGEIQDHFSRVHFQDHISVEESKNENEIYIESFISQIGQLRQKIQVLQEQNENLNRQKKQVELKLLALKNQTNFENPELTSSDQKYLTFSKNVVKKDCDSCFKLEEDMKYMAFKTRKMEEILSRKQSIIFEMNEQFSQQIFKYNKVFERLSMENETLKRYIDEDLTDFIEGLEEQVFYLKSRHRFQNVEVQPDLAHTEKDYYLAKSKYSAEMTRAPSQEYLKSNVFSNCSIGNRLAQKRSRMHVQKDQKQDGSKSRVSKRSLSNRAHSFKGHPRDMIKVNFKSPRLVWNGYGLIGQNRYYMQ